MGILTVSLIDISIYLKDNAAIDCLEGLEPENLEAGVTEHLVDDLLSYFLVHVIRGAGVEVTNPVHHDLQHVLNKS